MGDNSKGSVQNRRYHANIDFDSESDVWDTTEERVLKTGDICERLNELENDNELLRTKLAEADEFITQELNK